MFLLPFTLVGETLEWVVNSLPQNLRPHPSLLWAAWLRQKQVTKPRQLAECLLLGQATNKNKKIQQLMKTGTLETLCRTWTVQLGITVPWKLHHQLSSPCVTSFSLAAYINKVKSSLKARLMATQLTWNCLSYTNSGQSIYNSTKWPILSKQLRC